MFLLTTLTDLLGDHIQTFLQGEQHCYSACIVGSCQLGTHEATSRVLTHSQPSPLKQQVWIGISALQTLCLKRFSHPPIQQAKVPSKISRQSKWVLATSKAVYSENLPPSPLYICECVQTDLLILTHNKLIEPLLNGDGEFRDIYKYFGTYFHKPLKYFSFCIIMKKFLDKIICA